MPEGPLGAPRPLAKTRLKYNVHVDIPEEVFRDPPKAVDVLDKRVNAVQEDVIDNVTKQIGDVILAANRLTHPNKARVIDAQLEEGDNVPHGYNRIIWTYVIDGVGIGEGAEAHSSSSSISKLHTVIIEGDNSPISGAQKIREFDPGPIEPKSIWISTN